MPHDYVVAADPSSMEPMMSASMGGEVPGNHAAATEPVATNTDSPIPDPNTSKATM